MRGLFVLLTAVLMLPVTTAISDLTIYSEAKYTSQESAPILVEFFHGSNDDDIVEDFEQMDSDSEITLLHWRTGADDEGGGFPDDDANSRLMYHELTETPSVAINGFQENITDVKPQIIENEIDIDWTVQLIGSSEVELINITATWTNPQTLNAATQLHVFIIETEAVDSMGREVKNLVRDWAPSSVMYLSNNSTNKWNSTINYDHFDAAGVNLGDASHADDYEILLVLVGGFENDSYNRVLSLQRAKMPTYWQSVDSGAALAPTILLIGVVICMGFIVQAERKREVGLPKLEGSWTAETDVIEYKIISGNSVEIKKMTLKEGWKSNGKIKPEIIPANTTKSGKLRVVGVGDFSLHLSVSVDQLGDWVLDLNLPEKDANS